MILPDLHALASARPFAALSSARLSAHRGRRSVVTLFAVVLGLVLAVPPAVASAATRTEEKTHVVVSGQTLRGIAKRFRVSVAELREANDLSAGTRLKVGSRLVIPVAGSSGAEDRKKDRASKDEDEDDKPKKRKEREDKADRDEAARDSEGKGERDKSSARGADEKGSSKRKKGKDAEEDAPPKRAGYLRLVHDGDEWEGLAVDKKGRVTKGARAAFAKLLHEGGGRARSIDARLIKAVAEVSDHFGGKVIEVVSPPKAAAKDRSAKAKHDGHERGAAVDFHVNGVSNAALRDFCKGLGEVGVGFYPSASFVHLDVRDASAFWVE